jgi:hypothetical protein
MKSLSRRLLLSAALFGSAAAALLLSHPNLQLRKSGSISTQSGTTQFDLRLQTRATDHGLSFSKSGSIKHAGASPRSNWEWSFGVQAEPAQSAI